MQAHGPGIVWNILENFGKFWNYYIECCKKAEFQLYHTRTDRQKNCLDWGLHNNHMGHPPPPKSFNHKIINYSQSVAVRRVVSVQKNGSSEDLMT